MGSDGWGLSAQRDLLLGSLSDHLLSLKSQCLRTVLSQVYWILFLEISLPAGFSSNPVPTHLSVITKSILQNGLIGIQFPIVSTNDATLNSYFLNREWDAASHCHTSGRPVHLPSIRIWGCDDADGLLWSRWCSALCQLTSSSTNGVIAHMLQTLSCRTHSP